METLSIKSWTLKSCLILASVDPLSDGSTAFFERMASGKKAQASSKEDSLQTCQIKNQIKPLLMLKKSDQSPTAHKM